MDIVQSRRMTMARPDMSRLSQETLAIIGVGVALAALILTSSAGVRGEIQDVRDELRDVRAEARAEREAMRTEARADRESFQSHILRLTEQQGVLSARVDGLRGPTTTNP